MTKQAATLTLATGRIVTLDTDALAFILHCAAQETVEAYTAHEISMNRNRREILRNAIALAGQRRGSVKLATLTSWRDTLADAQAIADRRAGKAVQESGADS